MYSKRDWLFAALAALIVLIVGACTLTTGLLSWGDDSAAYITEGIAIVDGSFEEQAKINYYYHPSDMPDEAMESEQLVYAWGYPLMEALVYKAVGFSYDNIILYKLPLLLSISLTAGVLVLFFRRRFSLTFSFALAVIFTMSGGLIMAINVLYSDLPFLFLTVLSFFLMEYMVDRAKNGKQIYITGIIYGITLWLTYETRLSGSSVCIFAFAGNVIAIICKDKDKLRSAWKQLLPYLYAIMLIFISERFLLAPATSNFSDIGISKEMVISNAVYYYELTLLYLNSIFYGIKGIGLFSLILSALGFIRYSIKRENLHISIFLAGTIGVVISLPYLQGLRYLYNILPFILMYSAYGVKFIAHLLVKLYAYLSKNSKNSAEENAEKISANSSGKSTAPFSKSCSRWKTGLLVATSFVLIVLSIIKPAMNAISNLKTWGIKSNEDVYSEAAIEVYQYIKTEVPRDSIISFDKPRALYLNTGHVSFKNGFNGHVLSEADYYLEYKYGFPEHFEFDIDTVPHEVVFDNEVFTLYHLA